MTILQLKIENSSYNEIIDEIESKISLKNKFFFSYVNAYVAVLTAKNFELHKDLCQFSALYSDGIGMYWASKFLYGKLGLSERINGTDLYFKILELAEKKKYKVFFFGGGEEAVANLKKNLIKSHPKILIGGIIKRDTNFNEDILSRINHSNSDILFVGLGTPDQEKWIASFGKKCNVPIQISVGSGIDFLSGAYQRAPALFRKLGLEWLFRLMLEPKRLWKRYLVGIPTFLFLVFKQKFSKQNYI